MRAVSLALKFLVELAIFGLAVLALLAAGSETIAVVMAVLVVTSTALLTAFSQWEE